MKRIMYIASMSTKDTNDDDWFIPISSHNMSLYYINILNDIGYYVDAVSILKTKKEKGKCKASIEKHEKYRVITLPALGTSSNFIKSLYLNLELLKFLIKNTKNGEQLIIYHGINQIPALLIGKFLKRLQIVLYVGEIYQKVSRCNAMHRWFENRMLISGNKYIFASDSIKKYCATSKPSIILSGIFENVPVYNTKRNDGKIHIVYSGKIDRLRGAFKAVELAEYLSDSYQVHITGYGEEKDIKKLRREIDKVNKRHGCKIVFEGKIADDDYMPFLQSCDLGLSLQVSSGKFNNNSFPSKISVYLSNGLRVLVPDVPIIRKHELGKLLFYYQSDNPKSIAETIKKIDFKKNYDSRKFINDYRLKIENDVRGLLKSDSKIKKI